MRSAFLGFLFAAALSVPALAQEGKQDFTLVNKTGYELNAVYVSPNKADDWGDDIMGQDTLGDGKAVDIVFDRGAKTCKWDLMVEYSDDDSSAVWSNIDLCTVNKITIRYNRKTDKTTASYE
ncbi:conserved exported hypothetical protein [Rhodospirillaceae bacterium LM-1]|nr:conserved exported hypothetical protein [Rhodospirillaceae bacterium LM-1]